MTKVMTKYQLEHYEKKIDRHFRPLIDSQELLIKQYRTEATNNVVKKLAKKMGADKILQQMKDAEETMKAAQASAKTFFEKVSKKDKKDLDYTFERDHGRISVSDCEDQLRTWASDLVDLELQQRPEGKQLKDLKDLRQKAMDTVFESGTPDQLQLALDKVVKHIGITWAVDTSKIKAIAHN